MKVLVFLFLIGCASAFVPGRLHDDNIVDRAVDELLRDLIGDAPFNRIYRADDEKSEYAKKIREDYERVLEQVKDMISWGKIAKDEVFQQLKELRNKLRDLNVDIGDRAREIYNQIKEKAKDYIKNFLDKLGLKHDKVAKDLVLKTDELVRRADTDKESEYTKKIRRDFERVLEQVRDMISWGKIAKDEVFLQMKELKNKLKDLNVDIGDRAREIYSQIKEKTKEYIRNLLNKLGLKHDKVAKDLVLEIDEPVRRVDEDKVAEKLKDAFNRVLEKIKDAIEKGKTIPKGLIIKLKEFTKKLKEKNIDIGEKAKELYNKLREKAKDFLKNLLDKLGKDDESAARSDINIRTIFKRLKDALLKKISTQALIEKIETLFGKGNEFAEQLLEILKTKGDQGKQKLLDLIDRILGEKEKTREARSLQELYDNVRDYFKKLNIELKERYVKFGQWVKDTVKKGIDTSKSKLENVKAIAKEFIEKAKQTEKDIAAEALEFFRVYKEDLGSLWEHLKNSVKEVLKRED